MINEQFLTWDMLGTFSGALAAVMIVTQLTKDIPGIRRIPTQLYSYFVALAVMAASAVFGGRTSPADFVLLLINAAVVALSANGGYDAWMRTRGEPLR